MDTDAPAAAQGTSAVAVVQYGDDNGDHGVLYRGVLGTLWVRWPDGGADVVYRDSRGWYWDEYGDTKFTAVLYGARRAYLWGERLRVVSRRRKDIAAVEATLPPTED